ncbi:MAG: glycosyltransferase family 4 protein [Caldilineaceae bacterium]
MPGILVFALSTLLIAYFGVGGIRLWAEQRHLLAYPNARSSHVRPTPKGGGLAIVLACALVMAVYLSALTEIEVTAWAYLLGAMLIAGISWIDDIYNLPSVLRLTVHSLCALPILIWVGYWHVLPLPFGGEIALGWFGPLLTFVWIVGLTNIYNFMDGIDGLAAGQAVIAGIAWGCFGWWSQQPFVFLVGFCIAAACGGFLGHNWAPARIFMGDVGSAFLGYSFAVLTVAAAQKQPVLMPVGVLLLWPFLFDAGFTILRRLQRGENILAAHRSHLYQRLVIAGRNHRTVTLLYLGLAVVGAGLAGVYYVGWASAVPWVLATPWVLFFALWRYVVGEERHHDALSSLPQTN